MIGCEHEQALMKVPLAAHQWGSEHASMLPLLAKR